MRSDDIAISVRHLTKRYRLFGHPGDRVKQFLSLGLKRYHRDFTALEDVSFDIRRGETVGIIGRNGSGKSTLLQLICGILKPSAGTVQVNGRISALLELGAGFNPEFTGRENVYFQGALMGIDKAQMDGRFEAIAAFADIGEFIDQPVRTYSSGMFVRLAFAAAVHVDPEILVIDEALAVGDQLFQNKCVAHMERLRRANQVTIIFVSHNIRQVERLCERALLLEHGAMTAFGPANATCNAYFQHLASSHGQLQAHDDRHTSLPAEGNGVKVNRVAVSAAGPVACHGPLTIDVEFELCEALAEPEVIVGIHNEDSVYITLSSSSQSTILPALSAGRHGIRCSLADNVLRPGNYWIGMGIYDRYGRELWRADYLEPLTISITSADMTRLPTVGFVDLPFQWRTVQLDRS